jgi:hypothetical protein
MPVHLSLIMKYLHRRNLVKISLVSIVILTAREYAQLTYDQLWRAEAIVFGMTEKPYVYRTLIPWLARPLVYLGVPAHMALTVLVVLSAIGLLYGLYYLLQSFRSRPS